MALLFVLVGQCGNQVGKEICRGLPRSERTHHADGRVRCVGVDTEPKVIDALLDEDRRTKAKVFRESSFVCDESGRGNNWAYGYTGATTNGTAPEGASSCGPRDGRSRFCTRWRPEKTSIADRAMGLIREEVQRAGFLEAVVFVHSLAGGTGSGLGSRLLEDCRAAFEEEVLYYASIIVSPHHFGDTAVSSLNALLALNHLLQHTDIILHFSNQDVQDALAASTPAAGLARGAAAAVSLAHLNIHIARSVLTLMKFGSQPFIVSEWVAALAPHPMHKLAVVHMTSPSGGSSDIDVWTSTVRRSLLQQRGNNIVGCLWCAVACNDVDAKGASQAFAQHTARHPGLPITPSVINLPDPHPQRQVVTATSCPLSALQILVPIANLAGAKAYAGAYLHWYEKYGVLTRHFTDALNRFRGVVRTYEAFLKANAKKGRSQAQVAPPH
eukprot:TRINITY_DN560_c0_g2_i2.p1 TRINITY_DN560_c0_g2~~TRINITY_DN560_c0_g2_i2.p1  ORF type:complete len:441 (+),score=71.53 TRINITY_DN560_c0_g2_i2:106-1428(+)